MVSRPDPNSEDVSALSEHAPGAYALFDFNADALEHGVHRLTAAPFTMNRVED